MRTGMALALVLACLGCPGKSKNKPPTARDGAGAADPCAALASKVEGLYRGASEAPTTDAGVQLANELVAANVHMVLKDCRTDPATFVPCLSKAKSTADIESECLIPLDDEGRVEGRTFGPADRSNR